MAALRVAVLAGGVGGAKLAHGLALLGDEVDLSVIVNTGDDFEHLGLRVSPDIDTVTYTLAGLANTETGWGRVDESFQALATVQRLGGPDWFRLGDLDLGLHLERTRRLAAGESLTAISADFGRSLGIRPSVLPMSDTPVPTRVLTDQGELDFQDYFVRRRCEPRVSGFRFAGIEAARPTDEVMQALSRAEAVIFAPSNPFVSVGPILGLSGVNEVIAGKPAAAVSPIVGGSALKGPAAKMLREMGLESSAAAVAHRYQSLIAGFVIDDQDAGEQAAIESAGMRALKTDTVMKNDADRMRLARETLDFALGLTPTRGA